MKRLGLVVTCLLLPCVLSADIRSLDLAVADRTALVVWRETEIHFELVDHFGHTQTAPATLVPAVVSDPHVASDGERYLVVWRDGLDLDGVVVDQDGTSGEPHVITTDASLGEVASIAWYGTRYLVTCRDEYRGTTSGSWLTAGGVLEESFRIDKLALLAPHDDVVAVVWTERTAQQAVVVLSELDNGVLSDKATVVTHTRIGAYASPIINLSALAWNGSKYSLLFDRVQYPRSIQVCSAQFDADGRVDSDVTLDGAFNQFSYAPTAGQVQAVGSAFVITWVSRQYWPSLKIAWSSAPTPHDLLPTMGLARTAVLPNGSILVASVDRGLDVRVVHSLWRRSVRR